MQMKQKSIKGLFQARQNKDLKKIIENFLSLTLVKSFTLLLPLITLPYVLSTVGLAKFGVITMALSLSNYFSPIIDYSFGITATRDIAKHRHNSKIVSLIYSKVFFTQLIVLVISLIILGLIVYLVPSFRSEYHVFVFSFLILVGQTLFPDWYFQGIEEMKMISFLNVSSRLFFAVGIFVFIKEESDYIWYTFLLGIGSVAAGITAQAIIAFKAEVKLNYIKPYRIISELSKNFGVFVNQFFPQLYNNSTTFILGALTSNSIVGMYGAIKNITNVAGSFIHIMSRVFFPYLNRNLQHFNKVVLVILSLTAIGIGLILVFSDFIIRYFNISGSHATLVLCLLAISLIFLAIYLCFGTNYFMVKRKDKVVIKNTIVSSLIGFGAAFPLIIWLGVVGAAINLLFSRMLMGVGLYIQYQKDNKRKITS